MADKSKEPVLTAQQYGARVGRSQKFCSGCNQNLPVTAFYLRQAGDGVRLMTRCKQCEIKRSTNRIAELTTKMETVIKKVVDTGIDPWEQLPGESVDQYIGFCEFRKQWLEGKPKRRPNLVKVAEATGQNLTTMKNWIVPYKWDERVGAYVKHLEAEKRAKEKDLYLAMHERDRKIATDMKDLAEARLQIMVPEELTARELIQLIDVASKLEKGTYAEADAPRSMTITTENVSATGSLLAPGGPNMTGGDPTKIGERTMMILNILQQSGAMNQAVPGPRDTDVLVTAHKTVTKVVEE